MAETATPTSKPVDLNTPRTFPEIKTRAQWEERAKEIREQVLVSCGLWPLPKKTPLGLKIFGKIECDGYTVEKVYFQTYPGFYLAGNLYRPLGKGKGPFPGVLNPHGHWANGRMADDAKDGSVRARCISFARQGMVAFSYDMVGFNDTHFPDSLPLDPKAKRQFYHVHREFGTNRTDELWNISLMGLQTWNSIRALDFLVSLPDVDENRLACTGASGGGTQTFMLGVVDDRLAVQAPVCMVSSTMQGGCSCENAPGLRVKYSNMEIAAAAAPRPQILVAATGDWTKMTLNIEGPAIQEIYDLFGAGDRLHYVRFDFGHNYNQTSREAVYEWFGKCLLRHPDPASLKEQSYQKVSEADLRVFPDDKLPDDALPKAKFIESLKDAHRKQWQALVPHGDMRTEHNVTTEKFGKGTHSMWLGRGRSQSIVSVEKFKEAMLPAWKHTLQMEWRPSTEETPKCFTLDKQKPVVALVAAGGKAGLTQELGAKLDARGCIVLSFTLPTSQTLGNQFTNFFSTYNRTELQRGVGSIIEICSDLKRDGRRRPVILCAPGRTGLWAVLAAPAADAVIADCAQLDVASDEALLAPDLFCPGIRNIGTFEGAAMLAVPHPLLLHNTGDKFPTDAIRATYRAYGASYRLRIESRKLGDDEIAEWISKLKL
jgi:dienelactone hydrolase